jgi:hypothetical protein
MMPRLINLDPIKELADPPVFFMTPNFFGTGFGCGCMTLFNPI